MRCGELSVRREEPGRVRTGYGMRGGGTRRRDRVIRGRARRGRGVIGGRARRGRGVVSGAGRERRVV